MHPKINWAPVAKRIGVVPDQEIAEIMGCHVGSVRVERRRRGLKAPRKARGWVDFEYEGVVEVLEALGRTVSGLYAEERRRRQLAKAKRARRVA